MHNLTQKWLLSTYLLLAMLAATLTHAETPREWKKITDKNDIQVYRAHTEDTKMKTFRGVVRFPTPDMRIAMAIIDDEEELSSWMHMISKVTLVSSSSPSHRRFYVETRLPWPVKDRDAYIDVNIEQADDYSVMARVTQANDMPPPSRGYVRMPEVDGYISLDAVPDSTDIIVTYEMVLDPGGYIPSFLVNLITADVPYFTLKKMRKVARLEKYQNFETEVVKRRPWVVGEPAL